MSHEPPRTALLQRLALGVAALVAGCGARGAELSCQPFPPATAIPKCAARDADGGLRAAKAALAELEFSADGLSAVLVDGVLLHVSRAGRTAPAFPFDNGPDPVVETLTRVRVDGKVGFVDANLDPVVPPSWDFASPFDGGVSVVCLGCGVATDGEHQTMVGGRWGYIDHRGRVVVPVTYAREELPSVEDARRALVRE